MRKKVTKKSARKTSARSPSIAKAVKPATRTGKKVMAKLSASLTKRNLKKAVSDGSMLVASQYNQASKKIKKAKSDLVRAKNSVVGSIEQHPVATVATVAAAAAIGAGLVASKAVASSAKK